MSRKFFISTFTLFLARDSPLSRKANPACMKNTSEPARHRTTTSIRASSRPGCGPLAAPLAARAVSAAMSTAAASSAWDLRMVFLVLWSPGRQRLGATLAGAFLARLLGGWKRLSTEESTG